MTGYLIPAAPTRAEIEIQRSRFIASLAPVFSVTEAREFITDIRAEFADASHNVPVFVVGHGSSTTLHSSDDGEPSGTAGRPALAVLQGSGLGDVAVVVTRYFGGIKLGTGGLVRAYTDAVRAVLEITPYARRMTTHTAMFAVPYPLFEQARLLVAAHQGTILDEEFAGDVTLSVRFIPPDFAAFQDALRELSHGQIAAEIIETHDDTIVPLPPQP